MVKKSNRGVWGLIVFWAGWEVIVAILIILVLFCVWGCSESASPTAKIVGPPKINAVCAYPDISVAGGLDDWKLDESDYATTAGFLWEISWEYAGGDACEEAGLELEITGAGGDGVTTETTMSDDSGKSTIWIDLAVPTRSQFTIPLDMELTTRGSRLPPIPFWCVWSQYENYKFWEARRMPGNQGLYYGLAIGSVQSGGSSELPRYRDLNKSAPIIVKTARPRPEALVGLAPMINVGPCWSGIRSKSVTWCRVKYSFDDGWTATETDQMTALPTNDRQGLCSIANPYIALVQFDTAEVVDLQRVTASATVSGDPNNSFDIDFHRVPTEGKGMAFVSDYIVPIDDPNNVITEHIIDNITYLGVGLGEGQRIRLNPPEDMAQLLPVFIDAHLTGNMVFDVNKDGIVNGKDFGILASGDPNAINDLNN